MPANVNNLPKMDQRATYDAIVTGAGYAGLTAARILSAAGKKILVLEARDRVGGRVHTHHFDDGSYIDLGAQWIGPTQDNIYALAREYGIATFATHDEGKSQLFFNNRLKQYKGLIPPLSIPALLSLNAGLKKINRLSATINTTAPWASPQAQYWDSLTLEGWMKGQIKNKKARDLFRIAAEAIFAVHPAELSMLFALFYTKSGRDFDTLMNIRNGAQQDRFIGGADLPARKMAAELGSTLLFNHAVTAVRQESGLISVSGDHFTFKARKLILAVPPVMAARITYHPKLSPNKTQLLQRIPMGSVWKCYAIYDRPFWREKGLNGLVASGAGFPSLVFDNSPSDASRGILMGFVLADKARDFSKLNEGQRKENILGSFKTFFGQQAAHPVMYKDKYWAEEAWSGGCYTGIMGPHVMTSLGPYLRSPEGHIHWAGTETAEIWNGYIEGAIRSGQRAAAEILATLD
jgi:monoamine oxidase